MSTVAGAAAAPARAATDARGATPARTIEHRSAGLDFLRALAAVLVVLFHLRTLLVVDFGPLNPIVEGGNSGVFIFFALSGYLLYKPFVDGRVDLRAYALKRAARILPGYFVALAALVVITRSHLFFNDPLPYLTLSSSYDLQLRGLLGVAWTLSAEVAFYVLLPFIARLVAGRELLRLLEIGVASICLNLVHRLLLNDANLWLIGSFPVVVYAFVPGMILAVIEVWYPRGFRRLASPAALLAGVALIVVGCIHMADPIAIPTGAGTAIVIAWLAQHRVPGSRPLAFVGGASYALYLWHRDLFTTLGVAGLLVALAGSALSWMLLERPILDWGHRVAARWRPARPITRTDLPVTTTRATL